jgi:glycosyltransferase involved in cell wall biosynthesis
VRREIEGLRKLGVEIHIIANSPGPGSSGNKELESFTASTDYLLPAAFTTYTRAILFWLVRRPVRCVLLIMYLVSLKHGEEKNLAGDIKTVVLAVVLASRLRKLAVDSVHCPWSHTNATVALGAGRLLDVPVTMQARAFELHLDSCTDAAVERLRRADGVMTNSQFNYDYIADRLGPAAMEKVYWVHNSLPLNQPVKTYLREKNRVFKILSVGRLVPKKGFNTLISTIAQLPAEIKIECKIIGGASSVGTNLASLLEAQVRELGIEDRVSFLGALPYSEVIEHYQWSDVVVLAATVPEDGSIDITPNVLLEAMSMGIPVISTTVGAISELIEDGVSGFIAPVDDAAQIAQYLVELEQNDELASRMGQEARKRAVKLFNPDRNLKKLADFLAGA